jgi:hypothetical protein
VIESFETLADWYSPYGDLDCFELNPDRVEGNYSVYLGGYEDPGSITWIGEAILWNWGTRTVDWRTKQAVTIQVKQTSSLVPWIALNIYDHSGRVVYLHRESGDACLRWWGGGWRIPIESDSWTLLTLPLRQGAPVNCFYEDAPDFDWSQIARLSVKVYTGTNRQSPVYLLMDDMRLSN